MCRGISEKQGSVGKVQNMPTITNIKQGMLFRKQEQ